MDRKTLKQYCFRKPKVTAEFPFGPEVEVFKVMNKVFALLPLDAPLSISLKCDPEWAQMLRQTYAVVTPGYHLNHRHWNSIQIDGSVPEDEVLEMIDHSYSLVVKGLPKKDREGLEQK